MQPNSKPTSSMTMDSERAAAAIVPSSLRRRAACAVCALALLQCETKQQPAAICEQVLQVPSADASFSEWDDFTDRAVRACPNSSLAHWYRSLVLFRVDRREDAIESLRKAKAGDRLWTPSLEQQVDVELEQQQAPAGMRQSSSLPLRALDPATEAAHLLAYKQQNAVGLRSTYDPIGGMNVAFDMWNNIVNDVSITAGDPIGTGGTMWIPGVKGGTTTQQQSNTSAGKPGGFIEVRPNGGGDEPEQVGTFGNGGILNLSSQPMIVLRTLPKGNTISAVPLKSPLPPCMMTPFNVDFDGVRSVTGAPISDERGNGAHAGWWKISDPYRGEVREYRGSLSFWCPAPATISCRRADRREADWERSNDEAPPVAMVPIPGCKIPTSADGMGVLAGGIDADDGCGAAKDCASCTSRPTCGWCGASGRCMHGSLSGTPNCPAAWQPFARSCRDDCITSPSCVTCTARPHCGWCSTNNTCSAGTPTSPSSVRCPAWQPFPESCR